MSGLVGRSGRRIASVTTLDRLISHADTVTLRALQAEDIPLIDRGRLASQFSLKKLADRHETLNITLSLSDELAVRMLEVLRSSRKAIEPPPTDAIIQSTPDEP